jgi:hypothetical protein
MLSSASDKSATDPVIHHAAVLSPRTLVPMIMLPIAILVVLSKTATLLQVKLTQASCALYGAAPNM